MITFTACPDCGEDTTGLDRCAECWVSIAAPVLEPRSLDRIYRPRVDLRLRRALDAMHVREIRERAILAARKA